MPGIAQRIDNNVDDGNNDANTSFSNPLFNGSSVSSNGFWSKRNDGVSCNQLQKFWSELTLQARKNLLRIDKQTLFEHARKNMYCSRCNGLLLEGFLQIVMYGKSLRQDAEGGPLSVTATEHQNDGVLYVSNGCPDNSQDPSVHPWGGLTAARDGTLTLLDCYLYSKSLKGLHNVFDSARARERERELLYPDACGGSGRGWISQGAAGYSRGHGTRETCALHTARLSVETLVDFWSALGEETQQSLLRMKEEDFIERLMYRFDSKRFCRDCRRNVIREFKELKELKRMRRETRCTSWFCVADTAFQYEVSRDSIQADWHQTFIDAFGSYDHFEWAVGTGEGKSDILKFEDVGLTGRVQVNGLDLSGYNACYITLRAWKMDGRCNELCVKAHALQGQKCVHCRLMVGDGFVTITRGESITRFFEHAEEAEEEEDDDSMDKDGNELDGECSRPQKHAKSPELAREFLLDAATVIFKEQVEKAFREGTARQNAHSIFVCLALKLLEQRVHIACKEIIALEKQRKLLEEEEKEKREGEERKERRRIKEREKKLRRKERLRVKDSREKKCPESNLDSVDANDFESATPCVDEGTNIVGCRDPPNEAGEAISMAFNLLPPHIKDCRDLTDYTCSNFEKQSEDILDGEFSNTRGCSIAFPYDHIKYSRRKPRIRKDLLKDNSKWSDRRKGASLSGNGGIISKYQLRYHADSYDSTSCTNGFNKQVRSSVAKSNFRNDSKLSEKFQCTNYRMGNRYDSHTYNQDNGSMRMGAQDPKYVNKVEASTDVSKPFYHRGNKYTQMDCEHEINGRPKSKIFAVNPLNTKEVWEPLAKKCIRSNSDSDVTLRSTTIVESSESDQQLESCSTSSDEVTDISVKIEDNASTPANCQDADDGFNTTEKTLNHSKDRVAVDGELSSLRSPVATLDLSMNSSSNSDNCSSCPSEGDSNMYSNPQNVESTSESDSEESSQTPQCHENHVIPSHKVIADQSRTRGQDRHCLGPSIVVTTQSDCLPKEAGGYHNHGGPNVITTNNQPQCMLPQMQNQSLSYPIFQAPTIGYYPQSLVSWPPGPANGLMPFPHSNHHVFANSFGYGLNGMQYGVLHNLVPPLPSNSHVPVSRPVSQVNGVSTNESAKVTQHHSLHKIASTDKARAEAPALVDANCKLDEVDRRNPGFSLFHYPLAFLNESKAAPVVSNEGSPSDDCSDPADHPYNKKDTMEEYNLFAATNAIKFSFF